MESPEMLSPETESPETESPEMLTADDLPESPEMLDGPVNAETVTPAVTPSAAVAAMPTGNARRLIAPAARRALASDRCT
jgi:hypothetical protein